MVDWLTFVTNLIGRIPIERVLFPRPDNTKALKEFAASVEASESPKTVASEQKTTIAIPTPETPPKIKPQEAPKVYLPQSQGGMAPEVTVGYQNREIGKLLLRMERHYAQRLRINGVPCDCGSSKHLLDLESLCEETIPMVDNPGVYYHIIEWIKKVGPTSTDEAAKSGLYDEQYPIFSHEARDFRKEIIGSLDPSALFPQKPGEPEGTRILPVVSEEEREAIREKAHKKIEQVLSPTGAEQDKYIVERAREISRKTGEPYEETLRTLRAPIEAPHYRVLGWVVREDPSCLRGEFGLAIGITVNPDLPEKEKKVVIAHEIGHGESICKKLKAGEEVTFGREFERLAWQAGIPAAEELSVLDEYLKEYQKEAKYLE